MSILHQEAKPASGKKGRSSSSGRRSHQRQKPRRGQGFRPKERRGLIVRLFADLPSWTYWTGGLLIAAAYAYLFYYFFVGPFSFRWRAIYGDPPYPEGYSIRGIDISHYQQHIDWSKLREAYINHDPVRFVIIKATEGANLMDPDFKKNFKRANENGFVRGAYHFFVPGIDVESQAAFYLQNVELQPGDFPPILDVEKQGKLTAEELQHDVKRWLELVEPHYGTKPIIYTGYKFRKDVLTDSCFNAYPYWIAHYYVEELEYKGAWTIWQHTDCGKVAGIKGFVDCNIFNGTLQEFMQFTIKQSKDCAPKEEGGASTSEIRNKGKGETTKHNPH